MPVTITLDDELAQRLEQQAHARQVTLQQWSIQVLHQSSTHSDDPAAWRELNLRRFDLIQKRRQFGLDEAEELELAQLQSLADRWLEPIDQQRLEMLKPYEELAQRLMHQRDE